MNRLVKLSRSFLILSWCVFSFSQVSPQEAVSSLDPNLRNLSISGFLRTRYWGYASHSALDVYDPTKGPKPYEQADYMDLFFRNRFQLKVNEVVSVHSVFDIGTLRLGESSDSRLGTGGINLKTRDVYMNFRWMKGSPDGMIMLGLMPFSLPGGHILAKDAAGIKVQHRFMRGKLRPYFYFIKAVENSLADAPKFGDFENHNFNDSNIYMLGTKAAPFSTVSGELYYVFWDDKNEGLEDTPPVARPKKLHWIGIDGEATLRNWTFGLSLIGNFGYLHVQDSGTIKKVNIGAGLAEISVGRQWQDIKVSLISVVASGDVTNENASDSFQSIGASYGLSNIVADNSGGIILRKNGQMYGLNGTGLRAEYVLFGTLSLEMAYYHFTTLRDRAGRNFGDEVDWNTEYLLLEKIKFFGSAGIFLPGKEYTIAQNYNRQKPIFEVMVGAQTNY